MLVVMQRASVIDELASGLRDMTRAFRTLRMRSAEELQQYGPIEVEVGADSLARNAAGSGFLEKFNRVHPEPASGSGQAHEGRL
jgi:hypothetical protein